MDIFYVVRIMSEHSMYIYTFLVNIHVYMCVCVYIYMYRYIYVYIYSIHVFKLYIDTYLYNRYIAILRIRDSYRLI